MLMKLVTVYCTNVNGAMVQGWLADADGNIVKEIP